MLIVVLLNVYFWSQATVIDILPFWGWGTESHNPFFVKARNFQLVQMFQVAQLVRTEVLGQTEVLHRQLLRQNQDMADIKSLMHVLLNKIK